jgi:hypothetical protein
MEYKFGLLIPLKLLFWIHVPLAISMENIKQNHINLVENDVA